MSKPIKEILIGTMDGGKEVLSELENARKSGLDFITTRGSVRRKTDELHPKQLELRLIETEMLNSNTRRLKFISTEGYLPPFEAGQYINIFIEKEGVLTSRPYSLSSSPLERGAYELTVQEVKDGFVSSYLVHEAKEGDVFIANGPAGEFHDNPVFHKKSKVFLAGGSGITPFLSMSQYFTEKGKDYEIYLFYGARTAEQLFYSSTFREIERINPHFHFIPVFSEAEVEGAEHGFITGELIAKYVKETGNSTYYICGPEVMITFCQDELRKLGVREKEIRRELFGTRRDIENEALWPAGADPKATYSITVDGRKITAISGESVLTALERSGIRVNVCCRSGSCSFCRMQLLSGRVFTAPGALLRYTDKAFGYIHSCKAYPLSDLEIRL